MDHSSLFFRPNPTFVNPDFLYWILRGTETKNYLEKEARGSTMQNLNRSIVKNIPIALPLLTEQAEIVRRVEELFAWTDEVEANYTEGVAKLKQLPQTLLQKAFTGALVPQDPNDEPASELLAQILLEKERLLALAKESKKRK